MTFRTMAMVVVISLALWVLLGIVAVQFIRSATQSAATNVVASEGLTVSGSLTSPMPTPSSGIGTALIGGTASWYCGAGSPCTRGYLSGLYAAAGRELRVGNWRGSRVTVCAKACVTVTLIDACGCPGARIIDLYREAFARIAKPSRGVVRVTVELGEDRPRPTPPPTDTGP